ncbi:MAG: MATE family efflux transporter [Clostridia bacterium]|nr:MATE family efflux transporter [Clostridia bacterium]
MAAKRRDGTVDLTEGNLFKKIILFTLPIIFTGVLQLLFNAADVVVVGKFAGDAALAAVGSTGALINLIVSLLIGLSVGAGVCASKCFGAKDKKSMEELVHTAMLTSIIGGIVIGVIGFILSKYFLVWMNTHETVIEKATLYVRIYFIGVPFTIVYNFGAAILRAVGDTRRPLIFLVISGVINVLFNLGFVILLKMDVDGVAIATVIAQVISCVLVLICLVRTGADYRLDFTRLRIVKDKLKEIIVVGLPAGIQGSLFSISNVIVQSSINSFGDIAMSGNAAAANIEGFVYMAMNAFHQTAMNFTGQHIGAKKENKLGKIALLCLSCVTVTGLVLGVGAFLLARPLLNIYTDNPEVVEFGVKRMSYICSIYFVFGIMDVLSGMLRGMNMSTVSMVITLLSVCGLRIVWIMTAFRTFRSLDILYASYPISWAACLIVQTIVFVFAYSRIRKRRKSEGSHEAAVKETAAKVAA